MVSSKLKNDDDLNYDVTNLNLKNNSHNKKKNSKKN